MMDKFTPSASVSFHKTNDEECRWPILSRALTDIEAMTEEERLEFFWWRSVNGSPKQSND